MLSLALVGCAPPDAAEPAGADTAGELGPIDAFDGSVARLETTPTWQYSPGYGQGWLFLDAADVNKDGRRDLVMGRDHGTASQLLTFRNLGTASVYGLAPTATVNVAEFSTWGGEERIAVGDYNCDGELDAALGINGAWTGETNEGQIWFYAGQGGGAFASTPTWRLEPNVANARTGTSLAAIDANHDGCTDLIDLSNAGLKGILGGAAGPTWSGDVLPFAAGYLQVATVGDVNGDGNTDFGWCDGWFNSGQGRVVVFLGTGTGFPSSVHRNYQTPTGDNLCGGQQSGRGFSGGDIDNDGYTDLVIGAPGVGTGNGRIDVYRGSASGLSATPTWSIAGPADGNLGRFGTMVLSGFDGNGDGFDDLIVGEPVRNQNGSNYYGMVWMYLGSPIGPLATASPWSRTGTKLNGGGSYGHMAYAPGDVNGDGVDDVVLEESAYLEVQLDLLLGKKDPDTDSDGAVDPIDCMPNDGTISPLAAEVMGDGLDQNCNGYDECFYDGDKDGYGTVAQKNDVGGCLSVSNEATKGGDCNDTSALVNPGMVDTIGNGNDENCDGGELCRADKDLDLHGAVSATVVSKDLDCTDAGEAGASNYDDCDDDDKTVFKGATEVVADGKDQDCDGKETCYVDGDGDGRGGTSLSVPNDSDCTDPGEATTKDDCDDADPAAYPGATELVADGKDQDCDKFDSCYKDGDGDKFGGTAVAVGNDLDCTDAGEAASKTDCDDAVNSVYPGATEAVADGTDQDCDKVDSCYQDFDKDTYGGSVVLAGNDLDCTDAGEGATSVDCEDAVKTVFPGAAETPADGKDQDCDNGDTCFKDGDGDTYGGASTVTSSDLDCGDVGESGVATDCNDLASGVNPGVTDVLANGVDDDCDKNESCYTDVDTDTYGTSTPVASTNLVCTDGGEAVRAGDCADTDKLRNPAATEVPNNGIDENCDGTDSCLLDGDGDGFGGTANVLCTAPNAATKGGDCDDTKGAIHPGATESPADGTDADCDGLDLCFVDGDGDGDGSATTSKAALGCTATGFSATSGDCKDTDATIGPSRTDAPGNLVDEDCDGKVTCFADGDSDGHAGSGTKASADLDCDDAGEGDVSDDCLDSDAGAYPDAPEVGGDGIDQDCDGADECWLDDDGDGYGVTQVPAVALGCTGTGESIAGGDCDDTNDDLYPGQAEVPGNVYDDDCDGFAACFVDLDGDGVGGAVEDIAGGTTAAPIDCKAEGDVYAGGDCDDDDAQTSPDVTDEPPGDDRDCDGKIQCWTDGDSDGYGGDEVSLDVAPGTLGACGVVEGDCDDDDASVQPEAAEVPGDDVDEDCDGTVTCFVDEDGDGHGTAATTDAAACTGVGVAPTSDDCDDAAAAAVPGALEVCDGVDNDCDGEADEDFYWADADDPSTCSEDKVAFCGCDAGGAPAGGVAAGWMAFALGVLARRRRA